MKKFLRKHLDVFIIFGLLSLLIIFFMWDLIVITIYPGHTGVYFRRIFNKGTQIDRSYGEGVHFILPWNKMYVYDARIHELKQNVKVLSKNGLTINVRVSVRYYLLKDEVPLLHQRVGEDYESKVIIPSTISSVREVIGGYKPEELYTTARHVMQDEILIGTIEETGRLPIIYSDMIIEMIKLPDMINKAIENKLRQQQQFLEYQFRINKAEREKQRKKIEAEGIQIYQDIIKKSLSEDLLRWQGIQATKDIAESKNAKIVIIGGKDGLPIILNTEDSSRTPVQSDSDINNKKDAASPLKEGAETPKDKKSEKMDEKEAGSKNLSAKSRPEQPAEDSKNYIDAIKTYFEKLSQTPPVAGNNTAETKRKE